MMAAASASASGDLPIQLRQQDDAFLFVGIGAGDDRRGRAGAQIGRQMRHSGRNVEEVTGLDHDLLFEPVAYQVWTSPEST